MISVVNHAMSPAAHTGYMAPRQEQVQATSETTSIAAFKKKRSHCKQWEHSEIPIKSHALYMRLTCL